MRQKNKIENASIKPSQSKYELLSSKASQEHVVDWAAHVEEKASKRGDDLDALFEQ